MKQAQAIQSFKVGKLNVEIHPTATDAGVAAARATEDYLRELDRHNDSIGVIFATGASQIETLRHLTAAPNLPWGKITGFHMDEYVGLPIDHPASFRRYMREKLTSKVSMRKFYPVDGTASDLEGFCRDYAQKIREANPSLCLLGIGENGHLAFNDPPVADFNDPLDMKVVTLDQVCRQQQTSEGWFPTINDVPPQALTLTIPTLFRVPRLIATVPTRRKTHIVFRSLTEPVSTACPATLLREHPNATIYLDEDSAAELDRQSFSA